MKTTDFQFDLPPELIAQHPLAERTASRLLCLDRAGGAVAHRQFSDLPNLLRAGDLMVFNNTRVIPARMFARKESGGKVEILVERLISQSCCLAQLRVSKKPPPGTVLILENGTRLRVLGRQDGFFVLETERGALTEAMDATGHMPLPPYIQRPDEAEDRERYQTVYAKQPGAVAAPTAGLHFDQYLLDQIATRGVESVEITLHVGAGTFQPVRVENIEDHRMHAESIEVPTAVCKVVEATRARGGRVVAVGTTAVRSLESAAQNGAIQPFAGDSRIFIYPGYTFRVVDAMITNFHLPESTLLMLVSAFAGRESILAAYRQAVAQDYRFFSYGDAMFIA